MIKFVSGEEKRFRNSYIESLNKHKLNNFEYDQSKAYYLDIYRILKWIKEENDAPILTVFSIDFESDFTEYALDEMISDLDLIDRFASYEDWCENSVDPSKLSLKSVLYFYDIDSQGDEEELLLRIDENDIQLEEWLNDFSHLSEDGEKLLDDLSWVKFYDKFLDCFDFNDFYYFIKNKFCNLEEIALEFLDEHLTLANAACDAEYVNHCEVAKKLILLDSKTPWELKKSNSEVLDKFNGYVDNLYNLKAEEELKKAERTKELLKQIPAPMTEMDLCKMADNKYRLCPRDHDSYVMPVRLNQFEYYKVVEEFNDADLALEDLSFVPWCFRERLRDASFEEGFLTHHACKENWSDFSKDLRAGQLKEFLQRHGKDNSGNKRNLIKKIAKSNLPIEEFSSEKTFLSKKAYDFLKEYEWVQFYLDNLFYFDFLDFEDYLISHSGSFEEKTLNYLDEHIVIAHDALDFDYIIATYVAKSKILHLMGNFNEALTCDMRILHLNMNPICLDSCYYSGHIPLNPENISNLKELKSQFGDEMILKSFNANWNFLGFKSIIIPRDEVWKYLDVAINSKYQNEGSRKIREKYFMNFNKL